MYNQLMYKSQSTTAVYSIAGYNANNNNTTTTNNNNNNNTDNMRVAAPATAANLLPHSSSSHHGPATSALNRSLTHHHHHHGSLNNVHSAQAPAVPIMMMRNSNANTAKAPPTKKRKLVVASSTTAQRQQQQQRQRQQLVIKPSDYALAAFRANGADIAKIQQQMEPTFQRLPTPEMLHSYKPELLNLVRKDNLVALQELHKVGKLVNCCNKFRESLLHLACRRGRTQVVQFLLDEANIDIHIRDDYLRTPLHDACWTCEPNFELVDILIRHAPEHVVMSDARGFTPFDYVRKEHKGKWLRFLWERRAILKPLEKKSNNNTTDGSASPTAVATPAAPTAPPPPPLPKSLSTSSAHGAIGSKTAAC